MPIVLNVTAGLPRTTNWLDHCRAAFEAEMQRRQLAPIYRDALRSD